MIYFQDWKQGVKSCSWFPKKEKGVSQSDCERLPKFCRRAISTLLQFLDTLFLIAASSIFIVTTYCTNIFDRNYIALFQEEQWWFLLEINMYTTNNRLLTNNLFCFFRSNGCKRLEIWVSKPIYWHTFPNCRCYIILRPCHIFSIETGAGDCFEKM